MNTELEVKFLDINKDNVRKSLKESNAELIQAETLMRIIMFGNTENKEMKVHYVRVRDEGDKITMTAKIHARKGDEISDQKETEINVSNFEDAVKILELAGLKYDYVQEKYREIWELDGCEIVIDTYPIVEPLVEIEGESVESIKPVAEKLGFNWDDKVYHSVTDYYANKLNLSFEEALEKTKRLKF
ncbi:MAG: CYTH domain-containing protein [Candidatus Dojkabacteria bacterium]|nr:CYTH domain-containing protein [Candidatus Dojkabacteria bacterium]MDQ7020988.1 CYTH domain-containing protein [Candidatus Dojkabacteria bacterium]